MVLTQRKWDSSPHTLTHHQIRGLTWMFWGCGRKVEHPRSRRENMQQAGTQTGKLLWCGSANNRSTVPSFQQPCEEEFLEKLWQIPYCNHKLTDSIWRSHHQHVSTDWKNLSLRTELGLHFWMMHTVLLPVLVQCMCETNSSTRTVTTKDFFFLVKVHSQLSADYII